MQKHTQRADLFTYACKDDDIVEDDATMQTALIYHRNNAKNYFGDKWGCWKVVIL